MKIGLKGVWAIPIIASILILGTFGLTHDAFANHNDSHKSNLLLSACPDKCTVFVDQNNNGLCDSDERRFSIPQSVVDKLLASDVIVACGSGGL